MALIEGGMVAELWLPTSELPAAHPFALAASPDHRTLYVGCVGNGSNGCIVAIDILTKTQTIIASGLQYVKHGMGVDSAGNLYFGTGPNSSDSGVVTLHRWNGSSVTALWSLKGMHGFIVGPDDKLYCTYRNPGHVAHLSRRNLSTGAVEWDVLPEPGNVGGEYEHYRGMDVTSDYLITPQAASGRVRVYNRNNGIYVSEFSARGNGQEHNVRAISDREVAIQLLSGPFSIYDPVANVLGPQIDIVPFIPPDVLLGNGPYGNMLTTRTQVFVAQGGWCSTNASIDTIDVAVGEDLGIYLLGNISGWVVGQVGIG